MGNEGEAVVPATDLIEAVAENKATEVKEEIREEVAEAVAEAKIEAVIESAEVAAIVEERAVQRDEELWNQQNELESRITRLEASLSKDSKPETITETVTEPVAEAERTVEGVAQIPVPEENATPEPKKRKGWSLF